MCAIDDCETSDVWLVDQVRARKAWSCQECRRRIQPGETYQRVKSLYDGRWDVMTTCRHCSAAGVWMDEVCGGYLTEGLLEEMVEHWWEGYASIPFGRLIAGIKHRWHDGRDPVPTGVAELAASMLHKKVAPVVARRTVSTVQAAGGVL